MPHLIHAPGPATGLLGLSVARRFSASPIKFLTDMHDEYGPIVHLRFGPQHLILAFAPEAIQEVLVTQNKSFPKQQQNLRAVRQIDGNGLITTEGDFWLRQRRLVQKGFSTDHLERYADITVRRTQQLLDRWPTVGEVEICAEMTCLTLETIAEMMFEVDMAADARELAEQVEYLSERLVVEFGSLVPLPDWLPIESKRRKRRALRALHEMIRRVVSNRRRSGEDRGDMLSMLLQAVDTEGDGGKMTDAQVCDEITTLFVAGYDTTASGLAWTWYLLAQHPDIAEAARCEAKEVLGDCPASLADFERLPTIRQIVLESLRLYPPAWLLMLREANCDTELLGFRVPRKSWIYLVPWVTQRSPLWFADPLRFDPARFATHRLAEIPAHAYFPFGAGPHRCIGERLALLEMTLIVAMMSRSCRFLLSAGQGPVEVEPHTAIRPRGGLRLRVEKIWGVASGWV